MTDQGVAMLSGVLKSSRAAEVNVAIMRAFVRMRKSLESNKCLTSKFKELEDRVGKHDDEIEGIFHAIRQLMIVPKKTRDALDFTHGK